MSKKSKIVLLADDDLDDLEMLEEAFLHADKNSLIHTVSSASGVWTYLQNCPENEYPCLMVLDYNMPDSSGPDIIQKISANPKYCNIPTVIWSTSNSSVYREISKAKGARHYYHKPHWFQDIPAMVQHMLSFCGNEVSM